MRELPGTYVMRETGQGSFDSAKPFASEWFGCTQDDIDEGRAIVLRLRKAIRQRIALLRSG
jgi:hypothetical protein